MPLTNEITISISIFSIWPPVSDTVGPFFELAFFVQFEIFFFFFLDFDEYDPCCYLFDLFVLNLQFLFSILQLFNPMTDRLFLLLTVAWKVILIYSFWCVLR